MAFNQVTNLDFEDVKQSLREYLRASPNFTDYNLEGSVLSQLIDILAYNTYYSALNANLVANEVFLDSASIRENVVSLAKTIGYTPRSATAARAVVNLDILLPINSTVTQLTLNSGSTFIGNGENGDFVFSIPTSITKQVTLNSNGRSRVLFENLEIYQGNLFNFNYTVDTSTQQRYIIPDSNADLSLIQVVVDESDFQVPQTYKTVEDITQLTPTDRIYFIQENKNEQFELIFGDGVFGRKLLNTDQITITYISTDRAEGNNCNEFTFIGRLTDQSNQQYTLSLPSVSVISTSANGADPESISSIKFLAPKTYAAQNRAVTVSDYEVLIKQLSPGLDSLTVYGGEEANPPEYGKVFVAAKPVGAEALTTTAKLDLIRKLRQYTILTVVPEILDPSFLYVDIDTYVYYNSRTSKRSSEQLGNVVRNTILDFTTGFDLNKFNSKFKYSKLISAIDDADVGITSNITRVRMRKNLKVFPNVFASYEICYGNKIDPNSDLISNGFKITGQPQEFTFFFEKYDDNGTIAVYRDFGGVKKYLTTNVGSVDYEKGEININNININSVLGESESISLSVIPSSNDIVALRDLYLTIDPSGVNVNIILDELTSSSRSSGVGQIPVSS